MEVSHLNPILPQGIGHAHNAGTMAMETSDMNIDIDIDLGPIDNSEPVQQVGSPTQIHLLMNKPNITRLLSNLSLQPHNPRKSRNC